MDTDTIAFEWCDIKVGAKTIHSDKGTYLISDIKSVRYESLTPIHYGQLFGKIICFIGFAISGWRIFSGGIADGLFAFGASLWLYHMNGLGKTLKERNHKIHLETSKGDVVIWELKMCDGGLPEEAWLEEDRKLKESMEHIMEGIRNAIERSGT